MNYENMKELKSILLLISSAVILFVCFYYQNKIIEMKQTQRTLSRQIASTHKKEEYYNLNFDFNFKMNGLEAPDVFCTERLKEGCFLSEMVKNRNLLIYRFSDNSCNPCYQEELDSLQKILPENCDFIKVLCSFKTTKDLLIFKITNNIELPIYLIPFDSFKWIAEDDDKPYYFILHQNMKISNIYVPDRNFPELNKQYLEGVMRFFI